MDNKPDISKISVLAKVAVNEEQAQMYGAQLASILDYASQLQALNIADKPPRLLEQEINWRNDQVKDCEEAVRQKLLDERRLVDGCFKVKKVK